MRSGTTTVYLGGLWEETVGGVVRTYYTLAGQVVALRTVNGASNTVEYMQGDHLGSVSVVTTQAGVATTQEFDPWGKVRTGGITQTKRNFTGQYLDDTGLLFYNARYYDPLVARFISADPIGIDRTTPQTRNRYSYVLNNPLKYTDPTGHCAAGDDDDPERCGALEAYLILHGFSLLLAEWRLADLLLIQEGIEALKAAAGWGDHEAFKKNMIGDGYGPIELVRGSGALSPDKDLGLTQHYDQSKQIVMTFWDNAFNDPNHPLKVIIHELAHAWDFASGEKLSKGMMKATGSAEVRTCTYQGGGVTNCETRYYANGQPASDYGATRRLEDWAEAVTATILVGYGQYEMDNARQNYVNAYLPNAPYVDPSGAPAD